MSEASNGAARRPAGRVSRRPGILLGLCAGLAMSTLDLSAQAVTGADTVRTPMAFAETPPLRDIVPARSLGPVVLSDRLELEPPRGINRGPFPVLAPVVTGESVLQTWMGPATMPATVRNFEGAGAGLAGFSMTGAPPDTEGDVGPNHYVQWVNSMFAVWDKSGTKLLGPLNGNTLFTSLGGGCAANNDGDPLVLYDPLADRWFLSQFSVSTTPYLQCVAVSKTPDPLGAWYTYAYNYGSNFNDYGKGGVWPDGYYMMYHVFTNGGRWAGSEVCAFDRVKMVSGDAGATQQCFGPNINYGGLLPSHLNLSGSQMPPAGAPNYFLAVGDSGTNQLLFWPFHVDWTTPGNSTFPFSAPTSIPVAAYTYACEATGTCIPQTGTTNKLDSLGDRLMWRLNYRNFGTNESLVVTHSISGSGVVASAARWYEIRAPGAPVPTLFQQGTYSPDSTSRWMGSVNMDRQGNMALGYSASSSSINPGIRYAGRLVSDTAGTLPQAEAVLQAGTGSQTGSLHRWGDYSTMSVDPADGCTFWYTDEYLVSSGTFNWRTRIASFTYPGCTSCNPTQPTASATSPACAGQSLTLSTPTVAGATYSWIGPNGFTSTVQNPSIASFTAAETGLYTVVVTVSGCTSLAGTVSVAVAQPPTTATVGTGQTICASATTASLGGNTPTTGSGAWSVVSGGTGTFSNASSGTSTFTHTGGVGPITLRWTISNVLCPASTADVSITVTQPPTTATVGTGQTICASGTTASLGGNTPTTGTGAWSVVSGGTGTFSNVNSGTSTFTHTGGAGPITLRWTISNAPCTDSSATVSVMIKATPAAPVVTAPASVVPFRSFTASVPTVSGVTYAWVVTGGSVTAGTGTNQITVTAGASGTVSISITETDQTTSCVSGAGTASVPIAMPPGSAAFYALSPCRVADTRNATGTFGGPALSASSTRLYPITLSACGIPSDAKAVSANLTVTGPAAAGSILVYPASLGSAPLTSTLNFRAGQTRANNAILMLATDGSGAVNVLNGSAGSTDFIIDANGYFR